MPQATELYPGYLPFYHAGCQGIAWYVQDRNWLPGDAVMAKHTLNAFAGGHSRMMTRQGVLPQDAEPGRYRTLMEGLESCVGSMAMLQQGDRDGNWATADDGRRYLKYSRPARA